MWIAGKNQRMVEVTRLLRYAFANLNLQGDSLAGFSLINDAWIPAVDAAGGSVRWLRPRDIVAGPEPPTDVSWGRPDFRVATYELLIGLLSVAMAPRDEPAWDGLYRTPPSPEALDAAFAPLAPYLELDGDGPRFLQDLAPLAGDVLPPDALLIDMQGEDGTFFTKAGRHAVLSRAAAAIALYAFQAFAVSGGRGNLTSLRGGGPLTTLVMPSGATLWQRLWANVPVLSREDERAPANLALVFPWAAPTRTSETKVTTIPGDRAHALQAFFGMPRRVRLQFAANGTRIPCAVTGLVDDIVVTGFIQRPSGVKYPSEHWSHRLTPYYQPKPGSPELLPLHAKVTPIGYRQWIGLLYDGDRGRVAAAVRDAKHLLEKERDPISVLAAGFVTDNMKVVDHAESDLPLHVFADAETRKTFEAFARALITAADGVAVELRKALKDALDADYDSTPTETASIAYWARTELPFRRLLDRASAQGEDDAGDDARRGLREAWWRTLGREALAAFDDAVPLETLGDVKRTERVKMIEARKMLVRTFLGYTRAGAKLLSILALPAPAKAKETTDG